MVKTGSIVTHPLFVGSGVVVKIHNDKGVDVFEVFWQSMNRNGFHSSSSLKVVDNGRT